MPETVQSQLENIKVAEQRERQFRRNVYRILTFLGGVLVAFLIVNSYQWRHEVNQVRDQLDESQSILASTTHYNACRTPIIDNQAVAQAEYTDAFGQLIESLAADPPDPDITASALAAAAEKRAILHESIVARQNIEQTCPTSATE